MFKEVDAHPNFPKLEEEILQFWEDNKIFEKGQALRQAQGKKPFVFYDGPPFATGLPHYGHILASTIKDLIPRYQTMRGHFVRRRWGWDCHGLPIEEIVERELGISGKKDIEEKIGIKKFNETCRSMVLQYVREWGKMVRRIARWVDFENSYKTMDRDYMESVWWAFKQFYDKGLVYEGRKVLLYCPRCETPISNFEVAMDNSYETVTEEAVIVKFRLKGEKGVMGGTGSTYLLAWTTTPWTLPGNIALAVGKDIEYVKVKVGDEYYIVAKDRSVILNEAKDLDSSSRQGGTQNDKIFKGSELVGLEYEPLFEIKGIKGSKGAEGAYKVYAADFVNTEDGTGIVHTAVVYGEEDYELGIREGLPVVPLLDEKGIFNEKAPELVRGKYFKDSEKAIKDDLEKRGLLFERKSHEHSYPHCWRCGTMLYYNAIPAWFINISKIKNKILKSNESEINWYPEHLKHGRYQKSVEAAPDWNISRNRYWGNPMPVWRCVKCKKDTVVGSIEELSKKAIRPLPQPLPRPGEGGRRPGEVEIDLHRPYIDEVVLKCDHCGGNAHRISEIFDSWFEAGSMPFASVHYPFSAPPSPYPSHQLRRNVASQGRGMKKENSSPLVGEDRWGGGFIYPAQFVSEYIAQTRAWFYVMHVVGLVLFGKAPFKNVVTTGTILSEQGEKLSKSKRNFPDPWKVIEKYGADSLRFYLMNSVVMQADNLNFSEADLGVVNRKVFRILYNVYNYFVTYANEADWTFDPKVSPEQTKQSKNIMDRWLNARLQQTIEKVTEYFDSYDTVRASRTIEEFINELSTWYLRRGRGRKDHEFFATLYRSLIYISKLMAPVAPYMSEHIYRNLNHPDFEPSVHLNNWPQAKKEEIDEELLGQMQKVREIVEQAHAARAAAGVKLRQPLQRLTLPTTVILRPEAEGSRKKQEILRCAQNDSLMQILKDELNVKEVIFGDKLKLDTAISEELKLEGLTRELERQINGLRKEMGLKIGELVEVHYQTDSADIEKAMQLVDRKKVYAKEIVKGETGGKGEKELAVDNQKIILNFKL